MTIYHLIEILLVGAVVGACSVSVARHLGPNVRAWLHPALPSETDKSCGSGGCNGCSTNGKSSAH